MGIIIRQSIKSAFWSYLGIVIGYVNVGIIMPQFFDTAEVGLVQLFASVSLIFAQFGTLGFTSVINRMFPRFRDPAKAHNGFLFLALTTGAVGFILTTAVFVIFRPWVVETNIDRSPLLVDYLWWMVPLVLMRILFLLLDNYNKMLYDAVTGTFWMEFVHKVINLLLILLFAFGWIGFRMFFAGYLLSMSIPVLPIIFVLVRRGNFRLKPHPSFIPHGLRRESFETILFGFANGLGGVVLLNVDKVFVNQYLSLDEVGIFGVCSLFSLLIRVPYNSISKIAIGVVAEAWKRDDRSHVREIYRKSAINQGIVGTLIYAGILVNLDNIFKILPPAYEAGKWVLVIYSAGMLVNTVLGLAGNITEISPHFRYSTFFLIMAIVVQFGLSFLLIPRYGITGAAISTTITLIVSILMQVGLQWMAYGIYGVNVKLLIILAIGAVSCLAGFFLPELPLLPDIVLRSSVVSVIFIGLVLSFKVSPEVNRLASEFLNKVTIRK